MRRHLKPLGSVFMFALCSIAFMGCGIKGDLKRPKPIFDKSETASIRGVITDRLQPVIPSRSYTP